MTAGEGRRVLIFAGCVTSSLDQQTIEDALDVLDRCGYAVEIPGRQGCCGALYLHGGEPDKASKLARKNLSAFGDEDAPILTLASGCAATLHDYGRLAADSDRFRKRLRDLGSFLHLDRDNCLPALAPLAVRVAVFEPCTARNSGQRTCHDVALLKRIPSLDLQSLGTGYGCCGAAGHHFLTRPEQADELAAPLLEEVGRLDPDYLAIANVGCALHLAGALAEAGLRARVVHPISLIRRSLAEHD